MLCWGEGIAAEDTLKDDDVLLLSNQESYPWAAKWISSLLDEVSFDDDDHVVTSVVVVVAAGGGGGGNDDDDDEGGGDRLYEGREEAIGEPLVSYATMGDKSTALDASDVGVGGKRVGDMLWTEPGILMISSSLV